MKYIDVFRTSDRNEHSIIKNLFDDAKLDYRVHGEAADNAANIGVLGNDGLRIEVAENDREKAREIIKRSGFIGQSHNIAQPKRRKPQVGKWVFVLLAALVVLIAIIFFVWFMSGN